MTCMDSKAPDSDCGLTRGYIVPEYFRFPGASGMHHLSGMGKAFLTEIERDLNNEQF